VVIDSITQYIRIVTDYYALFLRIGKKRVPDMLLEIKEKFITD